MKIHLLSALLRNNNNRWNSFGPSINWLQLNRRLSAFFLHCWVSQHDFSILFRCLWKIHNIPSYLLGTNLSAGILIWFVGLLIKIREPLLYFFRLLLIFNFFDKMLCFANSEGWCHQYIQLYTIFVAMF